MYMYVHTLFLQRAPLQSVRAISILEVVSAIKTSTSSQWSRFSQAVVRLPSPEQKCICRKLVNIKKLWGLTDFYWFLLIQAFMDTYISRSNSTLGRAVYFASSKGRKLGTVLPSQFLSPETPQFLAPFLKSSLLLYLSFKILLRWNFIVMLQLKKKKKKKASVPYI